MLDLNNIISLKPQGWLQFICLLNQGMEGSPQGRVSTHMIHFMLDNGSLNEVDQNSEFFHFIFNYVIILFLSHGNIRQDSP